MRIALYSSLFLLTMWLLPAQDWTGASPEKIKAGAARRIPEAQRLWREHVRQQMEKKQLDYDQLIVDGRKKASGLGLILPQAVPPVWIMEDYTNTDGVLRE